MKSRMRLKYKTWCVGPKGAHLSDGHQRWACMTGKGTIIGASCFTESGSGWGQRRRWCPGSGGRLRRRWGPHEGRRLYARGWQCGTMGWGRGTSSLVLLAPRWRSGGGGGDDGVPVAAACAPDASLVAVRRRQRARETKIGKWFRPKGGYWIYTLKYQQRFYMEPLLKLVYQQ
jgi:hypothetical protein